MRYAITIDGHTHHVTIEDHADGPKFLVDDEAFEPTVERNGAGTIIQLGKQRFSFQIDGQTVTHENKPIDLEIRRARPQIVRAGGKGRKNSGQIKPPMPGKVVEIHVAEGDAVEEGAPILVLEAMKMQNDLKSPVAGTVAKVHVKPGQNVEATTVMVEIEPEAT